LPSFVRCSCWEWYFWRCFFSFLGCEDKGLSLQLCFFDSLSVDEEMVWGSRCAGVNWSLLANRYVMMG